MLYIGLEFLNFLAQERFSFFMYEKWVYKFIWLENKNILQLFLVGTHTYVHKYIHTYIKIRTCRQFVHMYLQKAGHYLTRRGNKYIPHIYHA